MYAFFVQAGSSGRVASFFITAFILISVTSLFAHQPSGDFSHIDAYVMATSTTTDIASCDAYDNLSNRWETSDVSALRLTSTFTATAIDNSLAWSPRNKVRYVLRHSTWVSAGLSASCNITDVTFDIKRIVFKQNAISRETIRTMTFPNISNACTEAACCPKAICIDWDGSFAIDDKGFGKVNGAYEATAKLVYKSTDLSLDVTLNYPNEGQNPVTIDVMDVHSIVSSPTVVGASKAPSFPVILNYKLAKSGYVAIDIYKDSPQNCAQVLDTSGGFANLSHRVVRSPGGCTGEFVRRLVDNQSRWGEDTTQGQMGNFETWDGRRDNGSLVSSGTYVFNIFAWDPYGTYGPNAASDDEGEANHRHDEAYVSTRSITLDPLQIIDLTVQPLTTQSTSFAGIGFTLTEAATVYFNIWKTSAVFANTNLAPSFATARPSNCSQADCVDMLIRNYQNQFPGKTASSIVWDGRDFRGTPMDDGNYVFSLWAAEGESSSTSTVSTSRILAGIIPVTRGLVGLSQIQIQHTAFSSPPVSGVAPYFFNYSLERDALIDLKILASSGQYVSSSYSPPDKGFSNGRCVVSTGCVVTTLVNRETRAGRAAISDPPTGGWDGRADNGVRISSGVYLIELQATDPLFPNRVSAMTASFPVNLLRVANVSVTPLLAGATDVATISYALSETMDAAWRIYPPTTTITQIWPTPQTSASAIKTIFGPRPGRVRVTEFWDGRNENGLFVADGNYLSVLTAKDAYGNFTTDTVIKEIPIARGQITFLNSQIIPTFPSLESSSATLNIPLEPFEIQYTLSRDALVTIALKTQEGNFVATLVNKEPRSGLVTSREFWDGSTFAGVRLTTANLVVDMLAEDAATVTASSSTARLPLSVDLLRIYDVAVTPLLPEQEFGEISYQLSEPMHIDIKIYKPGTQFNLAGNPFPPEEESLVFKIFGPRPGRTAITESWEGINTFQKQLPDGNYVFKFTAKDERGNTASDIITNTISVLRLGFVDPQATFDDQTFAYPNPATQSPVKICTLIPIDANVTLKIYNLGGDLVWDRNLGFKQGGTNLCGTTAVEWNLDNSWGKKIARGVYFYVLRADSVGGQVQFLQTRKKILIP